MADARTIATYDDKAADYSNMVSGDTPDASLQSFIDQIPQGGHVLDLGCGPGAASAHMRDVGIVPDPIDASAGMIALAQEKYGLDARLARFEDITGEATYDGVWANFSLLHAARADLPGILAALFTATKPGGILHMGMKTGHGADRDRLDRFYTYVTVDELEGLLTDAGFAVTSVREGEEAGLAGTVDPFVIMRGKKS